MSSIASSAPKFNWSDILPWTIIFRSLSCACSVTVLALALVGVVATPMGWIVSEAMFIGSEEHLNANPILAEIAENNRSPYRSVYLATEKNQSALTVMGMQLSGPRLVFEQVVRPFYAIFGGANSSREFMYFLFGSLWTLVVWSFAGLGIARVSMVKLTRNERAGLDDAFEYTMDFFPTCLAALSLPLGLAVLLCIPTFLIGMIMAFDFGALLVGSVWIIVLVFAFALGILLLGLMVSWPLIIASVAAEGQNAFDATTRAFAYAFQKPVNYLFYAVVATIFGGICWIIVLQFTESVIRLSYWSTAWGANRVSADRMETFKETGPIYSRGFYKTNDIVSHLTSPQTVQDADLADNVEATDMTDSIPLPTEQPSSENVVQLNAESQNVSTARRFIYFWLGFARTVAAAFIHGLFWCMASAIYLLLRKDVDETEMDEIYMIDERRTYDLPPLQSDEHGIPQVQPLPVDQDVESE